MAEKLDSIRDRSEFYGMPATRLCDPGHRLSTIDVLTGDLLVLGTGELVNNY